MQRLSQLQQRLFRWQSDGIAPFHLTQRRIFILPSRAGLLFGITLLAMLTGAINYGLALGYALVFLLAGLALAGMVNTFRNLYGLEVAGGRCEPVFAGEKAIFQLHLSNDRSLPRPVLELLPEGSNAIIRCDLPANATLAVNLPIAAEKRGWLTLPRTRLATTYPLGLFRAWSYLQPELRCLVYPAPVEFPMPLMKGATATGERRGDNGQEDFAGFRERQATDSLRHIAWKASARNDERPLLVKLFAGGAQPRLDLDLALTPAHLSLDTRLGILTAWVLAAAEAGAQYSLTLPGREIPLDTGEAHHQRCLEALAVFA